MTSSTTTAIRTGPPRATAVLLVLTTLAAVVTSGAPELTHDYAVVLSAAVVLGAGTVSVWLWATDSATAWMTAGLLAAAVGAGQIVLGLLGDPTGASAGWTSAREGVLVLAFLLQALVLSWSGNQRDPRSQAQTRTPERPYAL